MRNCRWVLLGCASCGLLNCSEVLDLEDHRLADASAAATDANGSGAGGAGASANGGDGGAASAPPFVRGVSYGSASSLGGEATSLSLETPGGTAPNDVLVAAVVHDSGTQFNAFPPRGETWQRLDQSPSAQSGAHAHVFWTVATGSEADRHTFTVVSDPPGVKYTADVVGGIWAVGGADTRGPLDAYDARATRGGDTCDAPSIDTTRANTLLLYACAMNNVAATFDAPASMCQDWDFFSPAIAMSTIGAHAVQPAPGATGEKSATSSRAGGGTVALLIAIAPAGNGLGSTGAGGSTACP